jgi:hypothetical protein
MPALTMESEFKLTLTPSGAEVLGHESGGNPSFTCVRRGKGIVYFLAFPLEMTLANLPGAFSASQSDPYWRIYKRIFADTQSDRAVGKESPVIGITEHPVDVDHRVVVAINYHPKSQSSNLILQSNWRLEQVLHGDVRYCDDRMVNCEFPKNDAVVFTIYRRQIQR